MSCETPNKLCEILDRNKDSNGITAAVTCRINEFSMAPLDSVVTSEKNNTWQCMQIHKSISISVTLPLDTVRAGDHWDLRISRQILPLLFMFGWYIFVVKAIWNWKKNEKVRSNTKLLFTFGIIHIVPSFPVIVDLPYLTQHTVQPLILSPSFRIQFIPYVIYHWPFWFQLPKESPRQLKYRHSFDLKTV